MALKNNSQRVGGIAINWTTIIVQVLISLFFTPFFLKIVGDKQYGLYSFSTSIITWLDTLLIAVGAAYYTFLTKEKKESGDYGEARACGVFFKIFLIISILVLAVGFIFDGLLFLGVIPLNEYSSAEKNQICLIILMSVVSSTVTTFFTVSKSYPYYKQSYILVYGLYLLQIIAQTALSVVFLKIGLGVVFVALSHFGMSITSTLIMVVFARLFLKMKISFKSKGIEDKTKRKKLTKEIMVFSSFIIINTVADLLNKGLDKTILGFANADSVATYQLAYSIPSYMMSFTSIFTIVFTQKLIHSYFNDGGVSKMNEVFIKVSKIQTIFTFLLVGGFLACGKEFIFMWLDNTRAEVFYVAAALMLVYSLTCSNGLAVIARRTQNLHTKASFIYLGIVLANMVLSIGLVSFLPREYKIWGCVIGTAITYLIGHYVVMQIYDHKKTKLDISEFFNHYLFAFLIMFVCTILSSKATVFIPISSNIIAFIVKGSIFALLYISLVFVFKFSETKSLIQYFVSALRNRKK